MSGPTLEKSTWVLHVDGSSNLKGSGAGIVLEEPGDFTLKYSLRFNFLANNNQAQHEALIARMRLAKEVGVMHLTVKTNSQLVAGQVRLIHGFVSLSFLIFFPCSLGLDLSRNNILISI